MNETLKEEEVIGFGDGSSGKVYKEPKNKKSGGFQGMGLSRSVLRGILKKGYKVPTPIQRKTIPLVIEGRDVVAMARTGSGKTACFLLPLFEKLKTHSTKSGIRAIVLSPTRELAIQTLKFLKELGRFTGLRSILLLGGDSMETQFSALHDRPDIVVGTPGRFLHICVEMDLSLKDVQYVVFDEADRLFEMGFGEQLREIIHRLPEDRQTVLFSATLPKVLVEFARAGLSDPALIRLDVETKIPDTLELSFVSCRPEEKPAALLCLLNHIVNRDALTIIFAATKHHVEYLHALLTKNGIPNTYIYSDLDPCARKINVAKFRLGRDGNNEIDSKKKYKKGKKGRETDGPWSGGPVRVLIVTDVAARGIDIPHLDYVINYNFPAKVKLFVHRVGRCARAGRAGHALSMVSGDELCYLLDLMLFLGRPLTVATPGKVATDIASIGKVPPLLLEPELSQVNSLHVPESDLDSLRKVSENAYKKFIKCRSGSSRESVKRAKELATLPIGDSALFSEISKKEEAKSSLIAEMKSYRPPGTIFEIGTTNKSESYTVMKTKRKMHKNNIVSYHQRVQEMLEEKKATAEKPEIKLELSNSEDIASTFSKIIAGRKRKIPDRDEGDETKKPRGIDKENFIPYMPSDQHFEQGLAVNNFSREANAVGVDLTGDTKKSMDSVKQRKVWDKKKKRLVTVGGVSKEGKIKSESGAWIPATYKSGRYKDWVEKTKDGHTEEGDSDEEQQVNRRPANRMSHTHWGKHNLKVEQKKKIGLKRPEQIVKAREQMERKRRRHGRHNKKGKKSR